MQELGDNLSYCLTEAKRNPQIRELWSDTYCSDQSTTSGLLLSLTQSAITYRLTNLYSTRSRDCINHLALGANSVLDLAVFEIMQKRGFYFFNSL
jgi:hypothetical protein